jgi:hypothetical protein
MPMPVPGGRQLVLQLGEQFVQCTEQVWTIADNDLAEFADVPVGDDQAVLVEYNL